MDEHRARIYENFHVEGAQRLQESFGPFDVQALAKGMRFSREIVVSSQMKDSCDALAMTTPEFLEGFRYGFLGRQVDPDLVAMTIIDAPIHADDGVARGQ
jgi:hypothetical protein